jgi:hypothetical protein
MADESGLSRNRRYVVWDTEKASLNKLQTNKQTNKQTAELYIAARQLDDGKFIDLDDPNNGILLLQKNTKMAKSHIVDFSDLLPFCS